MEKGNKEKGKLFQGGIDAWMLATTITEVFGAAHIASKSAQSKFYEFLDSLDDDTKLQFFEFLEMTKIKLRNRTEWVNEMQKRGYKKEADIWK